MRPTNLPSARSAVVWTRGTPLWTMTVNAGACAAARETDTPPSRARNARPDLTSEAVIESQRESQRLAGGHRLRHVQTEPSPIDAQTEVGEPAAQRREPIGGRARAKEPWVGSGARTDGGTAVSGTTAAERECSNRARRNQPAVGSSRSFRVSNVTVPASVV